MIAPRIAFLVAALVLPASVDLPAQQEPPVAPGDRVRVTARNIDPDPLVGTLVALGADTCVLEVKSRAEPLALPLASVTKLEVSRERRSKAGIGATVGFIGGALAGAVIAIASLDEECGVLSPDCDLNEDLESIAPAAVLGGLAGIGVGVLVGSVLKVDRWEEVPLDRLRVSIMPQRHGLSVGVSVKF